MMVRTYCTTRYRENEGIGEKIERDINGRERKKKRKKRGGNSVFPFPPEHSELLFVVDPTCWLAFFLSLLVHHCARHHRHHHPCSDSQLPSGLSRQHEREEGGGGGCRGRAGRRPPAGAVALVLLAEAHPALPAALGHADVVHHEQVDLDVVGAAPPHLQVRCNKSHGEEEEEGSN